MPPVAAPAISTRRDPFTAEAGTVIKSALRARMPRVVPSGTALAAAYDYDPSNQVRSWLMDTGCKYDLTTRASVPPNHQDLITDALIPLTLSTANGLVSCTQVVGTQIGGFEEVAEPYLLDATPDVLSIGRRCVEDGCEFHWGPFSLLPTRTTAKGTVVKLISRDCCPYLDDFEPDCLPAVAAIASGDKRTISGDPKGPTFVEPLTASIHMR